ncbi:MAG: family 10 glycosylhydrolase [Paludibacteraceae bacterium]
MKKIYTLFALLLLAVSVFAAGPKRDFRASWVATVYGIDWPKSKVVSEQKKEMDVILDRAQAGNMTAVMFQVRGFADAMYKSSYDPWSSVLTGTRGKDPGYDPLQYAIEGAHRRGLELHVWINPYRLGTYSVRAPQIKDSWILPAGILDPGNPDVRKYILDVIAEIIDNYDIDGLLFDDYFYKSMDENNYVANETHQTIENNPYDLSLNDWRRENVNIFVRDVMKLVETKKPYLRFGIGPAGIWSTTSHKVYDEDYNDDTADYITANLGTWDVYSQLYCDAATWLKRGYIDYISPQLYWPMLSSSKGYYAHSAFDKLCPWWANLAKKYGRHFYVSQDVADNNSNGSTTARYNSPEEINAQMQTASANGNVQGHIFYNTQYFLNLRGVNAKWFSSSAEGYHTFLTQSWFADKSVAPAIEWRDAPELSAPSDLVLTGSTLTWKHASAPRFTVYAYPKGTAAALALEDASNLLGVTYSNTFDVSAVAGLADKTLAVCAYDRYGNEYAPALYNAIETALQDATSAENILIQTTSDGVTVSFEGTKTIEVYAVNGILLDRQTVSSSYSSVLPQGMYILRVGDSVHKFIK